MRVIFVDNEESAHINFRYDMKNHREVVSLDCFYTAQDALNFTRLNPVDCAFLDIDLGDHECGLDLAKKLKEIRPDMEIAFLTAFSQHTQASYQLGGRAYLNKPYDPRELDAALDVMYRLVITRRKNTVEAPSAQQKVIIKTFGNFDLMVDGCAAPFKNGKAKEALAFLVHQMGGSVSGAQIFFALWEAQEYNATTAVYVRRTIRALETELTEMGLGDILVRSRNCYSINVARLSCDSYALLKGDEDMAHRFAGEYMRQYSWGENTIPLLERAVRRVLGESMA